MPTPAGYLARGSIRRGGAEGAYFWLPCWCSRVACFQLSAPAWHGGVEAGRSAPWPPGELGRPWGSSVAPGGARSLPGSSGGAQSPPAERHQGELGRPVLSRNGSHIIKSQLNSIAGSSQIHTADLFAPVYSLCPGRGASFATLPDSFVPSPISRWIREVAVPSHRRSILT